MLCQMLFEYLLVLKEGKEVCVHKPSFEQGECQVNYLHYLHLINHKQLGEGKLVHPLVQGVSLDYFQLVLQLGWQGLQNESQGGARHLPHIFTF